MNETTTKKQKISTQNLVKMAMFTALLCVSAYISIPLPTTGMNVTLLNFMITLISLLFPLEQSLLIIVVWMLLGAVGIPVFIGGSAGIGYLFGPLGGYTLTFLLVALLVPLFRGKKYNRIRYTITALFSVIMVDLLGMVWLKVMNGMPWKTAWIAGFFSFIALDLVKAVIAAQIVPSFQYIDAALPLSAEKKEKSAAVSPAKETKKMALKK
jgi:biotin transport system substrate-specific component